MKIVSIGEVLWDILPSTEHLGGAPFNFAWHAHNLGHEVCFVSAVGDDPYGNQALERIAESALSTRFIRRVPDYPTGTVTVATDSHGLPHYAIHRPAAYDFPALSQAEFDALLSPAPDWIYFGTLQQMSVPAHDLTLKLMSAAPAAKRFYDINLRINSYTPELVRTLARHAHVLKLNEQEIPDLREISGIQGEAPAVRLPFPLRTVKGRRSEQPRKIRQLRPPSQRFQYPQSHRPCLSVDLSH